jgi:hypothetical protein
VGANSFAHSFGVVAAGMTTAVDIAKPIYQAQRAATGVIVAAGMTTETQVLFLICANLRNLRIRCVTSVGYCELP